MRGQTCKLREWGGGWDPEMYNKAYWIFLSRGRGGGLLSILKFDSSYLRGGYLRGGVLFIRNEILDVRLIPSNNIFIFHAC